MSDNNNININTPDIGPYTQLRPFRFWCQKVLPLVYDESLSYYELLCKVVDYLNKTMEDVDQMITDMGEFKTADTEFKTEVRDAYITFSREVSQAVEGLETFVNNYFNNLDVQQEINNKLDVMAEAGYFDALFARVFSDDVIATAGTTTSTWIANNLLQETGYVIDNSLTVANAAADAKAVGDRLNVIEANQNDLLIEADNTEYTDKLVRVSGLDTYAGFNAYKVEIPENVTEIKVKTNFYGNVYIIFTDQEETAVFNNFPYAQYPESGYANPTTVDTTIETNGFKYAYIPYYVASGVGFECQYSVLEIINEKVDKNGTGQIDENNTTFFTKIESANILNVPDEEITDSPLTLTAEDNYFVTEISAPLESRVMPIFHEMILPAGTYTMTVFGDHDYASYGGGSYVGLYTGPTKNNLLEYAFVSYVAGTTKTFTLAEDTTIYFRFRTQDITESNTIYSDLGSISFKIMLTKGSTPVPWADPQPSYVFNYAEDLEGANIGMFEKIGVIGDSYASGQIYLTETPVNYYNLSWGQVMARRNGATCINFSRGGLTTQSWLTDASKGLAFMQASEAQGLYIVALGINDYTEINASRYSLGTDADFDLVNYQSTPDTFYGNMCKIIGYVLAKSPGCKIILSTMALNDNALRKAINSAIERCAELANIVCIKQYEDEYFNSDYYINGMNYGHPTAPNYSGMAKAIERLCNKCMAHNYTYFANFVWS